MTGLLRKIIPVVPSIPNDDDDDNYNVEYSFAMEYLGPPVSYDIPRVVPVDVDRVPTAAAVASASLLNNLALPVIQPLSKKSSKELKLGSEATHSPNSVTLSGEFVGLGAVWVSNDDHMSCKSLDVIVTPGALGLKNGKWTPKLSDEIGSSGTLGFSDSRDGSCELSGSSDVVGFTDDCMEGGGLINYLNPTNSESTKSGSISQSLSSEVSSWKGEDCDNDTPCHVQRTAIVTFRDPESSGIVHGEFVHDEAEIIQERQEPEVKEKKRACHRCFKGNRFTEKEACIVCGAKYCSNCVLRAMGSMPEGRKCVPCIGSQIDESKRGTLGKCSRMLKRLFSELEVKQMMRSEILCEVNQLPPGLVHVNGKRLCQEELVLLQSCPNPPKKLKPGDYWYDKVSGFWGKEGQKPCQLISPHLNVGQPIMRNASNGNTKVLINNREITKAELCMLQLAGVQCEGNPHFWVSADGSYQEEGQRKVKGRIWGKTRTKLVCAVLSLPIPSESTKPCEEVIPNYPGQRTLNKLLLVGYNKSGTSTIFKQAKILFNVPFSEDDRQNIKFMIQRNLYGYLGILLEGCEQFEEESLIEMRKKRSIDQSGPSGNSSQIDDKTIYSIGPRTRAFSDWLLKVMVSGNLEAIFPAATCEYAPYVEELWKDAAIQATYNRRSELKMLPRVASYFLDRAVEVLRTDYEPSDMDILYAEGITLSNGLSCMEFSFPKSPQDGYYSEPAVQDHPLRYQLIRVHARSLGENCKWLEMFEDVDVVLFCVSLTDYDQFCDDGNGVSTNKMLASKKLFESIVSDPTFYQKDFLLVLNKFDLLEEKIEQVPLTKCDWFHDFNPVISLNPNGININNNPSSAQRASHYIAVKFKRLFNSLTQRKLYVSLVTGLEPDTVDEALRYASEILRWDEEKSKVGVNEWSSDSNEASTTS